MTAIAPKRTYLKSSRMGSPTMLQMAFLASVAMMLVPPYWLMAWIRGVPGLNVRWKCVLLGLRLFFRRKAPIDLKTILILILYPLDSTRYFELDYAWTSLTARPVGKYLDISSPRILFTLLLLERASFTAELINPDKADLAETRRLLVALGLESRCRLHDCLVEDAPLAPESFDVITCISVVEHIPRDREAVRKMWELLKPGGRLLLTVPCAATTSEQYIDRDEFGVQQTGDDGHVFMQRFYDSALLRQNIFSTTGLPRYQKIFGERMPGLFLRMATRKRNDRYYPFWREPYMTAVEYDFYDSLEELPGEGAIAMEFVKA